QFPTLRLPLPRKMTAGGSAASPRRYPVLALTLFGRRSKASLNLVPPPQGEPRSGRPEPHGVTAVREKTGVAMTRAPRALLLFVGLCVMAPPLQAARLVRVTGLEQDLV